MTIVLYTNTSEKNRVTKTLTALATLTGTLRTQTNIINPAVRVSDITTANITACNYIYITEFGRKYFVTNITSVRENVWDIECHIDVLSTYSTQILAQTAVIKRQENTWNLYLDDGVFKTFQNPDIVTKAFPSGFTTQKFVLAIAGG